MAWGVGDVCVCACVEKQAVQERVTRSDGRRAGAPAERLRGRLTGRAPCRRLFTPPQRVHAAVWRCDHTCVGAVHVLRAQTGGRQCTKGAKRGGNKPAATEPRVTAGGCVCWRHPAGGATDACGRPVPRPVHHSGLHRLDAAEQGRKAQGRRTQLSRARAQRQQAGVAEGCDPAVRGHAGSPVERVDDQRHQLVDVRRERERLRGLAVGGHGKRGVVAVGCGLQTDQAVLLCGGGAPGEVVPRQAGGSLVRAFLKPCVFGRLLRAVCSLRLLFEGATHIN